ncbi:hypothetical protein FISHEDRAFT_61140 [Fistulina hepatica ATCC 64428]|uniref:Uncharacterized protein n=1 Tax=Fistulina hepatica ATCC 64428 TaxID=1128425 RepID=A0A0D7A4W6_9AGAR|nr:hypothetical protein FISHEDRAFT_61140 [Fistulina hepatica ATCC 64428]
MASTVLETLAEINDLPQKTPPTSFDVLTDKIDAVAFDDQNSRDSSPAQDKPADAPVPSFITYSRRQILLLHDSPLVQLPPNMPDLKDWFGTEIELVSAKKDGEQSSSANNRDRRPRKWATSNINRCVEATVTATVIGTTETKTGSASETQLSEKYDRDRLGLSRHKERDAAPHLASGASRLGGPASKKKGGETSDDWRRVPIKGGEPRSARDDREGGRARSRLRDSSRSRREPSTSRRDRDDDYRGYRRSKDADYDHDNDDPRRWRDDGKRDERLSQRRERRNESYDDRRWTLVEERDGRSKRTNGRERKSANGEEGKERGERGERQEKEPAWMDTYVPTTPTAGILGGQAADGELDGIQAWKKDMKDKEFKEKNAQSAKSDQSAAELDQLFQKLITSKSEEQKSTSPVTDQPLPGLANEASLPTPRINTNVTSSNGTLGTASPSALGTPGLFALTTNTESSTSPTSVSAPRTIGGSAVTLPASQPVLSNAVDGHPPSTHAIISPVEGLNNKVPTEPPQSATTSSFNPPVGSRLLAFARNPAKPVSQPQPQPVNGLSQHTVASFNQQSAAPPGLVGSAPRESLVVPAPKSEGLGVQSGFSPFDDPARIGYGFDESLERRLPSHNVHDIQLRAAEIQARGMDPNAFIDADPSNAGFGNKGSRFAKFFDGKVKEGASALHPNAPMLQNNPPLVQTKPPLTLPSLRQDSGYSTSMANNDSQAMDDIFAMLNNSAQRINSTSGPNTAPASSGLPFGHPNQASVNLISQPPLMHHIPPNRLDSLYDSRMEDRSFVPDGMVPGLRPVPPARDRGTGMFPDPVDEALNLNIQRFPPQQQRLEQMYSAGPVPPFGQATGRNSGLMQQQQPFRNTIPSPGIGPQVSLQTLQRLQQQQQPQLNRLPPGLANLGGRPPHDPAFIGIPGMQGGGIPNNIHSAAALQQQSFNINNFPGGGPPYGGPQLRGAPQQLQPVGHHSMGPLVHGGHGSNLDTRPPLLGLGGLGAGGGVSLPSLGVSGAGGFPQQQGNGPPPLLAAIRAQQQQPLPHMMSQLPTGQANPQDLLNMRQAYELSQPNSSVQFLLKWCNQTLPFVICLDFLFYVTVGSQVQTHQTEAGDVTSTITHSSTRTKRAPNGKKSVAKTPLSELGMFANVPVRNRAFALCAGRIKAFSIRRTLAGW